jgi:penicillin-binding protein-related factor A (putative recombinase)
MSRRRTFVNEKYVQQEVLSSIKKLYPGIHVYNIPDLPVVAGLTFQSKRPYDFFVVHKGRFIAVELKLTKNLTFPLDRVRPHQWAFLRQVAHPMSEGKAYIAINFRKNKLGPRNAQRYEAKKVNRLFFVRAEHLETLFDTGEKSVSLEDVINLSSVTLSKCVEAKRISPSKNNGAVWDIDLTALTKRV